MQNHVRALQSLNETTETWNALLIVIIKEKLTQFLRKKWEEYNSELKHPFLEQMVTFLQIHAQIEDTKLGQNSHNHNNQRANYRGIINQNQFLRYIRRHSHIPLVHLLSRQTFCSFM